MLTSPVVRVVVALGALVFWESLPGDARAQNLPAPAIVSGVFVDSAGLPIRHAVLSVVGESLRVVTDSQGRFRLAVPPGPKLLAARALGYRPLMWAVTLVSGQENVHRISLGQLTITLPGITVVAQPWVPSRLADFYQRGRTGLGKYIDREAIERRFPLRTADLLQGIAGVRVTSAPNDPFRSVVSFARCTAGDRFMAQAINPCILGRCSGVTPSAPPEPPRSVVGVYVDGFRIGGDPGEALALVNPSDVEAIEVYRGPSELPAEFMSDACAAIVIWTKY